MSPRTSSAWSSCGASRSPLLKAGRWRPLVGDLGSNAVDKRQDLSDRCAPPRLAFEHRRIITPRRRSRRKTADVPLGDISTVNNLQCTDSELTAVRRRRESDRVAARRLIAVAPSCRSISWSINSCRTRPTGASHRCILTEEIPAQTTCTLCNLTYEYALEKP
jgi:hypothetical protein